MSVTVKSNLVLKVLRYDLYEMRNNMTVGCESGKQGELILSDIQSLLHKHKLVGVAFFHGVEQRMRVNFDEIMGENGFKTIYSLLEMYPDGEMRYHIAVVNINMLSNVSDITFMYRDWERSENHITDMERGTGDLMLVQLRVDNTTYIIGDIICKDKSEASAHFWAEQALSYAVERMGGTNTVCMVVGDSYVFRDLSEVAIIRLGFVGRWFHTRPRRIPAFKLNTESKYSYHCWLEKYLNLGKSGTDSNRVIYCNSTTGKICDRLRSNKKDAFIADLRIQL